MTVDYLSTLNSKGSGLNITQIVDSLVAAERTPQEELIKSKIEQKNTSISAIAEIKNSLNTLSNSIQALSGNTSLKASSNNTSISISISNPSTAKTLDSVTVSSLATDKHLLLPDISSEAIVGGGTLVLERDWSSGSFVASTSVSSQSLTIAATDTLASLEIKLML